jgi:hypothetical protein
MVRAAMRRIVPGNLATTGRLCGQHNNVSLPEEFVEECFDRMQFAYFSCADDPETRLLRHEI